jgi:hypothetical protein
MIGVHLTILDRDHILVLYKIDTSGIHNSSICIVSLLIRTIGRKQECMCCLSVVFRQHHVSLMFIIKYK